MTQNQPQGHEDHNVVGIIEADGSVRPIFCNTCSTIFN